MCLSFLSLLKFEIEMFFLYLTGREANAEEKRAALKMADDFISQMNYPKMKTQVCKIHHMLLIGIVKEFSCTTEKSKNKFVSWFNAD